MRASPWRALVRLAATQGGLISARQAVELGCSLKQLSKYAESGKLERVERALYRMTDFPPGEHDDLMAIWLWSRTEGVLSHDTALYLHDLSSVLPTKAHITMPSSWKRRAVQLPSETVVHYDDLLSSERGWIGALPVTTVRRTLLDCLHGSLSPELVQQAFAQAAARGLISNQETVSAPFVSFARGRRSA
ncbi:MAG TPA: type IV toxin-antitoxin system AbiEi family antitoxin domain-containing protein [Kofleriaceae bacterium]